MASIVKRGKTYSVVYYEGEGKNRHQVWESGLSYTTAKSRKATIEYEMEQNTHIDHNDITVSEFLYEFVEKYGEKNGWLQPMTEMSVCLKTMFTLIGAIKSYAVFAQRPSMIFTIFCCTRQNLQLIWGNPSGSI